MEKKEIKSFQVTQEVANSKAWQGFNETLELKVMREKDLSKQTAYLKFLTEAMRNGMRES
jgi:hypothetical protein